MRRRRRVIREAGLSLICAAVTVGCSDADGTPDEGSASAATDSASTGGPGSTGTRSTSASATNADTGSVGSAPATSASESQGSASESDGSDTGPPVEPTGVPSLVDGQLTRNGERLILNGDTPWTLPVQLSEEEALGYLDTRAAHGVNALLVEIVEEDQWAGPLNSDGEHPFEGEWFETPNETYWQHIDWLLAEADQRGMVVMFMPAYLGFSCSDSTGVGGQGLCARVRDAGPTVMEAYGAWVGERYGDVDNIIYVFGGDTDLNGPQVAAAHNAMVDGIASADDRHLTSYHCYRGVNGDDCYPAVDLNTAYGDCNDTPAQAQAAYASGKPFYFIEGEYGGGLCSRSQAYWTILLGASGHLYGASGVWTFEPGWESAMDDGAFMQHLSALFASRPPGPPAPELMTSGTMSESDFAAIAASEESVVAYIPTNREVTVTVPFDTGAAWWFNPLSGDAQSAGDVSGSVPFTPPTADDWVLVIDDAALDLPAPGTAP